MLWLKFIAAITVDITTSYRVPAITYQNLIADFPSIENAYKNWIISEQDPLKKKKKSASGMKTGRVSSFYSSFPLARISPV